MMDFQSSLFAPEPLPVKQTLAGNSQQRNFMRSALQEYAELFPVVGGDFSFYGVQDAKFWNKLFTNAPRDLKWNLKLPQDFAAKRFSPHAGAQKRPAEFLVSQRRRVRGEFS